MFSQDASSDVTIAWIAYLLHVIYWFYISSRRQIIMEGPSVLSSECRISTVSFFRNLISNFCHVLNAVCFLLGNSPVSEFYMPTFRNTLSVPSSQECRNEDRTEYSEMLSYKIQTPGNYPEESTQQFTTASWHIISN